MTERPLVLATNDDGIEAPGLWHLAEAVSEFADVLVVAPAFNQSGMSAAFTLRQELEAERAHSQLDGIDAFQVNGTPTDAVLHGIRHLAPRHIDMIVSGVNPGPNVGRDILHSGTVMAAMQGYLRNLPSVAASLWSFEETHLRGAALIAGRIAHRLLDSGQVQFLNVNAPDLPFEQFNGVRVTPVADVSPSRVIDRIDEQGATHRQLVLRPGAEIAPDTDVAVILDGSVSVTPLHNDLTFHAKLVEAAGVIGDGDELLGRAVD